MINFFQTILKFENRPIFESATHILKQLEKKQKKHLIDIGYSDMLITVFDDNLELVLSELHFHSIWEFDL